jgi:phospholipid/cholesterol/gamma-HCH transport system permease protein
MDFIPYNITFALIKSVVFAFLVSAISSYKGYFTTGGALEVGAASTGAVNNSIIAILIADFVLAAVLL